MGFRPTREVRSGSGSGSSTGRDWATDLFSADCDAVIAAAIAAVPITIFFFFDQNVSSLLCQKDEMHLKKGSYFHSSFFCMAVFNTVGPAFGLPFVTGSLPHSPQLVSALTTDQGRPVARSNWLLWPTPQASGTL